MKNTPTVTTTSRHHFKYRGVSCLNCDHPLDLSDKYCPNCSQANTTKKISIKDFFEEFFSNILSYDSKLFQTLAALLLKPGKITTAYIAGKRLSYTNPFRFLLSLAIIYFLLISLEGEYKNYDHLSAQNIVPELDINLDDEINPLQLNSEEEKKALTFILDSMKVKSVLSGNIKSRDSLILSNPNNYFNNLNKQPFLTRILTKVQFFETVIKKDTIKNYKDAQNKYKLENSSENKSTFSISRSLIELVSRPGSFINDLISKLPFATFFFLPIFSLFVWLVYIRKKYTYTDHLIFSFHNQSLLFILLIVSYLLKAIFNFDTEIIFILIFSIYLYKAMSNYYKQGRFKTIIKYVLLNTIFVLLASLTAFVLIVVSAITY